MENCRSSRDFGFIYVLALCSCNARLNQNLYVNNFFINLLKINNKNEYFTFKLHNECMLCETKVS